ncbi:MULTISPECIES: hypothetical protein [Chryseobacterium]|uniref:Tail fiber protein n=1 Tax=Chryseobacterium endophyticum TaxID=1854762 RepID=A0AAU6WU02_9FLAO|nr:hypothetical protein [uncultured Chryseobacterium sp.]
MKNITHNKKRFFIAVFVAFSATCKSQVGINNTLPKGTLDVTAQTTDGSKPEGIIVPRLSGNQIKAGDNQYSAAQTGAIIYATAPVTTTSIKTANISKEGYYYFDGSAWQNIINGNAYTYPGFFSYGHIKCGLQFSDHNGWILLNGRSVSSLTATQQSRALALGFSSNLPNAADAYPVQNGQSIGSITGSNTTLIAQNQLPNISPSVTISSNSAGTPTGSVLVQNGTSIIQAVGDHTHSIGRRSNSDEISFDTGNGRQTENSAATTDRGYINNFSTSTAPDHAHSMAAHSHSASFTGSALAAHNHTVTAASINGGVTQQPLNIAPKSMSVNMFIYLGN